MSFSPAEGQTEEMFASAWKAAVNVFSSISCSCCGVRLKLEDDGIDVSSGGFVRVENISSPKIESLNLSGGTRAGGQSLVIFGSSLDIGKLVVKFGGKPAKSVTKVTATSARVITPVGQYTLNSQEVASNIIFTSLSGVFNVGDTITTKLGSRGKLRLISEETYWIGWTMLNESVASLIGMLLTGSSGGSRVVASSATPTWIVGEGVTGLTSGAKGVVSSVVPFIVDSPSKEFAANELVKGDASGAYLFTASKPFSGAVDVSVENEHGQRDSGGVVSHGFTYL